jgi:methyltransferase (TIGR00027 family)
VFEVDRDEVFDYKETVLKRLNAQPMCERRLVRVDLSQPWTEPLVSAGFDANRPAAFLVEGLLMYLDESDAIRLIESIGSLAREGSRLGLDLVNTEMLVSAYTARYMTALAEAGCPWKFGVGVDEAERFLSRPGWQGQVVIPGEPEAHYGRWQFPVILDGPRCHGRISARNGWPADELESHRPNIGWLRAAVPVRTMA